jgi:hypothetical protein
MILSRNKLALFAINQGKLLVTPAQDFNANGEFGYI